MNKMYGFDGEVKHKGNDTMVELFHEVFRTLPLAHCVGGKILVCTHTRPPRHAIHLSHPLCAIGATRGPVQ